MDPHCSGNKVQVLLPSLGASASPESCVLPLFPSCSVPLACLRAPCPLHLPGALAPAGWAPAPCPADPSLPQASAPRGRPHSPSLKKHLTPCHQQPLPVFWSAFPHGILCPQTGSVWFRHLPAGLSRRTCPSRNIVSTGAGCPCDTGPGRAVFLSGCMPSPGEAPVLLAWAHTRGEGSSERSSNLSKTSQEKQ